MWTEIWPTEPGSYWYYGWCFKDRNYPAWLHFVRVRRTSNNEAIHITNGHSFFKVEGGYGMWCPVNLPDLPKLQCSALTPHP